MNALVLCTFDNVGHLHFELHLTFQVCEVDLRGLEWRAYWLATALYAHLDVLHGFKDQKPRFDVQNMAETMSDVEQCFAHEDVSL